RAPATGFRGFMLSLVVSQPGTVDGLIGTALAGGATTLKPAAKGFWGYGGVVRDPGGAIWKVATSSKKDTGPATRQIDGFVLLFGVSDVKAARQFYAGRGLAVAKSFGSKYVQFDTPSSPIGLALYSRRAAAKDAGVSPDGTGSHRIVLGSDPRPSTARDGCAWQAAPRCPGRRNTTAPPPSPGIAAVHHRAEPCIPRLARRETFDEGHPQARHGQHRRKQDARGIHRRGTRRDERERPRAAGGRAPRPARGQGGRGNRPAHQDRREARSRPRPGAPAARRHHRQRAGPVAQNLVRDARLRQERQDRLLLPA